MHAIEQDTGQERKTVEPANWVFTVDGYDRRQFPDFDDFKNDLERALKATLKIGITIFMLSPRTTGLIVANMGQDRSRRSALASTVELVIKAHVRSRLRVGGRNPGVATLAGLDTGETWDITRRDENSGWKQLSP